MVLWDDDSTILKQARALRRNEANMFGRRWNGVEGHWQHMKVLFNPIVTRFFISWFAIAPVFVRLTEGLPETVQISGALEIKLGLPFNWTVLWLASLAYAVAFAIYTLKCPKFVKDYPSYQNYEMRGHSPRWLVWEYHFAWDAISEKEKKKLLKRAVDKQFVVEMDKTADVTTKPIVLGNGTTYIFDFELIRYRLQIDENLSDARVKDMFWEIFGRHSASSPMLRHAAWFLVYVAGALTALVAIQNIVFVLSRLDHLF